MDADVIIIGTGQAGFRWIVGAALVGAEAGELIHVFVVLMQVR